MCTLQSDVHAQLPPASDRVPVERGAVPGVRLRGDARQAPRSRRQERLLGRHQEITQQVCATLGLGRFDRTN